MSGFGRGRGGWNYSNQNQGFGKGGSKGGGGKGGRGNQQQQQWQSGGGSQYDNSGGKGSSKGRGKGGRQYSSWGGGSKGGGSKGGGGGGNSQLPVRQATLSGHTDTVTCLTVSEAKSQCFSGSKDGTIRIWGWANGFECQHTLPVGAPVECIMTLDSWLIAGTATAGASHGIVKAWNMDSSFEQSLEGHQGSIYCLAQGGAYLFSGGDDMGIKTWQYQNDKFEPVIELKGHQSPIQVMKAAGNVLLSADRTGTVSMWDLNTGTSTLTIATGHTDMLMAMWVEESYLFTASLDGRVKTWQSDGTPLYEHGVTNQHGQPSGITALLLTTEKDGGEPVLITACNDNALKMWKMPTFDRRGILGSKAGHADIVRCMAKGPGNSFFTGAMDNTIMVWEFL